MKRYGHTVLRLVACLALGSGGVILLTPRAHADLAQCSNTVCTVNVKTLELYCAYQPDTYCGFLGTADSPVCVTISKCVPT